MLIENRIKVDMESGTRCDLHGDTTLQYIISDSLDFSTICSPPFDKFYPEGKL